MSETDDTDILLLIPPNFFLVPSSDESSCVETARTVVPRAPHGRRSLAALHATLGSLEHRVTSLELSSSPRTRRSSIASDKGHLSSLEKLHAFDRRSFTFPRRRRRKVFPRRNRRCLDTSLASTRSSSVSESIPPLALSESAPRLSGHTSEPERRERIDDLFVMDSELSSVVSSPSKKTDTLLLNEIDDFLNKVESYESPDSKLKNTDNPENLLNASASGEYISQKLDNADRVTLPSGRTVPCDFLDKYIYLVKNPQSEQSGQPRKLDRLETPSSTQEVTPKRDEKLTIQQKDFKSSSVRRLNFSESGRDAQTTSTPKLNRKVRGSTVPNVETFRPYKMESLSTCDTLSNISSYPSPQKEEFKYRRYHFDREQKMERRHHIPSESKYPNSIDTELLSLSELWSERDGNKVDNAKLEEERVKREHCKAVIQDLQKKVLEQQEKLAVAIKVDKAKDNAIHRLKDEWNRITSSLEAAEARHKTTLEKINCEMANLKQSAEESQKKTRHFENEMYKTLDLAHDYQEKYKMAQNEKQQIKLEQEKLLAEKAEVLQKKEQEIESLRENNESVMRLNKQLTDCIKNTEDALEKERSSHNETRRELSSANKLAQSFQEELGLAQQEREVLKDKIKEERSRCSILEKQIGDNQARLAEAQRNEKSLDSEAKNLRKHLELQKDELKTHYQKQLEEAVLAKLREFQLQLDAAEREMERDGKERENHIVDTYNKRILRIEEQHKLEVSVLEEKQREEIKLYRLQLAQASEKIGEMESKVDSYRRRRGQMASQLHGVMESQWRQALDILTGQANTADTSAHTQANHGYSTQNSTTDLRQGMPGSSNVRAACDPAGPPEKMRLPNFPTEKKCNAAPLSDIEMQHYVKMLLSKPPDFLEDSCDPDASRVKFESHASEEPTSDRTMLSDDRPHKQGKRSLNANKPPWKA